MRKRLAKEPKKVYDKEGVIKMEGLEILEYTGVDYKPVVYFEGWRHHHAGDEFRCPCSKPLDS